MVYEETEELIQFARLEFLPCPVANVEYIDLFLSLQDPVDYPVDMRLAAVKQLPDSAVFRRQRASVGIVS
jgi:hypothetical protein